MKCYSFHRKNRFYDRDAIEVGDRSIYIVIGSSHPNGRVISYLKYIPMKSSRGSIWMKNGIWYRRILPHYGAMQVSKTVEDYLQYIHPNYLVYDDILGINMIEIPVSEIKYHYIPEERLCEILNSPKDQLEELVRDLIIILSSRASVDINEFGISGSILLDMHNIKYSDIDLLVYGFNQGYKVKNVLMKLFDENNDFTRLKDQLLNKYSREMCITYPLTYDEAVKYYSETWSRGLFKGRFFSIHPVLRKRELPVEYGDQTYRGVGFAEALVKIMENKYSIFNPSIYIGKILNIKSDYKLDHLDTIEIVSYESIYTDIAEKGEVARVYGKLEEVHDYKKERIYYRILVGSFEAHGKDYVIPIRWFKDKFTGNEENI